LAFRPDPALGDRSTGTGREREPGLAGTAGGRRGVVIFAMNLLY
jgi:hypothetical protein